MLVARLLFTFSHIIQQVANIYQGARQTSPRFIVMFFVLNYQRPIGSRITPARGLSIKPFQFITMLDMAVTIIPLCLLFSTTRGQLVVGFPSQ